MPPVCPRRSRFCGTPCRAASTAKRGGCRTQTEGSGENLSDIEPVVQHRPIEHRSPALDSDSSQRRATRLSKYASQCAARNREDISATEINDDAIRGPVIPRAHSAGFGRVSATAGANHTAGHGHRGRMS